MPFKTRKISFNQKTKIIFLFYNILIFNLQKTHLLHKYQIDIVNSKYKLIIIYYFEEYKMIKKIYFLRINFSEIRSN